MMDVFLAQHLRDVERDFPHDAKVISKVQGTAKLKNIRSENTGRRWTLGVVVVVVMWYLLVVAEV